MKNLKGKMRPQDNPYETHTSKGWTWKVLKHYQSPKAEISNPYARVFCAVQSPFTSEGWDLGDVYLKDIARELVVGIKQLV